MNCKEIISILEVLAPQSYAKEWDNVGLLVGDEDKVVKKIMIALDATRDVILQAKENHVDMLITHHPLLFSPIKKITNSDFMGKKIIDLIRSDITYFAMHTNFDAWVMAEAAAKKLSLTQTKVLEPDSKQVDVGFGRYGYLEKKMTLEQCAIFVKDRFGLNHVNMIGDAKQQVSFLAISPGSGKSTIKPALLAGVDVLVTGDMNHHDAIDAYEQGLCIIDGGHFGTEHLMVEYLKQYLQEYFESNYKGLEHALILTAKEQSPFVLI